MASNVHSFAVPAASGNVGDTSSNTSTYFGFSVRETVGAVGSFNLRDGGASGKIIEAVSLAANQSVSQWYGPQGLRCRGQLYYEKVAGAIEGAIRHG